MKKICAIVAVVLLLTVVLASLFSCTLPVYEGITGYGIATDEEDIPVTVQSCRVTLDITDLPEESDEPKQYNSTATIDYRFYNPTDSDVDIPLHLPVAKSPYYKSSYQLVYGDTTLTVDGNPINAVTRCKYSYYDNYYSNDEFSLPDGYLQDDYFNDDLVIYASFYKVNLPFDDDRLCVLECTLNKKDKVVFNREINKYENHSFQDTASYYILVKPNDILTVYSFGKQMSEFTYGITETRDGDRLENANLAKIAEIQNTFEDIAFMYYHSSGDFVRSDWYNAVLQKLQHYGIDSRKSTTQFDVTDELYTWYDYTITVPANGTVNHSVTMPLFPYIRYDYTPDKYWYYVDLANLKSWSTVNNVEIIINTDYYALGDTQTEVSVDGIQKQSQWQFEFSSVAQPSSGGISIKTVWLVLLLIIAVPEAIALIAVIIVAVVTRRRKRPQTDN